MQEILHVPDDIPQDLLDKARCVVVMPSVLKAALVVGGSYGRGTMGMPRWQKTSVDHGERRRCMHWREAASDYRLAVKPPTLYFC